MKNLKKLEMFTDLTDTEMEELRGGYTPIPDYINIKPEIIKIPDICVTGICPPFPWERFNERLDQSRITESISQY